MDAFAGIAAEGSDLLSAFRAISMGISGISAGVGLFQKGQKALGIATLAQTGFGVLNTLFGPEDDPTRFADDFSDKYNRFGVETAYERENLNLLSDLLEATSDLSSPLYEIQYGIVRLNQTISRLSGEIYSGLVSGAMNVTGLGGQISSPNQGNLGTMALSAGAGGTSGAVIGATLASVIGPLGTVTGAVLGSIFGTILGGIFGKTKVKRLRYCRLRDLAIGDLTASVNGVFNTH
jgi:hypothetical protein